MTEYLVHLTNASTSTVRAETLNLGLKKLWFYDAESNLIAVFVWEQIAGFEVVGSGAEQQLTDVLLHETKTIDVNRRLQTAAKGELWVSLNEAADYLDQSVLQLGQAWLKLHEWRTRKPNETAALLERRQADLQHIEARFLNQKKLLVSKIQMNLDELTGLFTQPKT